MNLLLTTLYCALVTKTVVGIKQCDDCLKINECDPAYQRFINNHDPETNALLNSSLCGFEKFMIMVCCSDFLTNRFSNGDSWTEIENHRNINLLPADCGDIEGNRIVGGTAAGLYEFPWLALIQYKHGNSFKFMCGGTVITSRYVLTAAHCILDKTLTRVRIGDYYISRDKDCVGDVEMQECESKYQDIAVTGKIRHPLFDKSLSQFINDIGLLRLAKKVDFSVKNAATICLPITKNLLEKNIDNAPGVVAGWGMTEMKNNSDVLLKTELTVHSASSCDYKSDQLYLMEKTICAYHDGHDTCKGDSGGPLMIKCYYQDTYKYVQFGVVSYGSTECGSSKPGIYTDVRKYLDWILNTIKP